jgi:hypothetical protein
MAIRQYEPESPRPETATHPALSQAQLKQQLQGAQRSQAQPQISRAVITPNQPIKPVASASKVGYGYEAASAESSPGTLRVTELQDFSTIKTPVIALAIAGIIIWFFFRG